MTSISKNVYIGKLDDIVNKYTNTYHRTIKMKSVDGNPSMYISINKKIIRKPPSLKLVIMLEYQDMKIFLEKSMFQDWRSFYD